MLRLEILYEKRLPPRKARYGRIRLPEAVRTWLKDQGIRLYTHQTRALRALHRHPVVALTTPTASGKSLVYELALMGRFLEDPDITVLYVSPLKALLEDQHRRARRDLTRFHSGIRTAVLSGDTPSSLRQELRRRPPHLLLATPEMLHTSILPYHPRWEALLRRLWLVVLDEAHVYRGVFGSHLAAVLRRLNFLWRFYGGEPRYLILSATLEGGEVFFRDLTGLSDVVEIRESGAPRPEKTFIVAEVKEGDDVQPPQDVILSYLTRRLIAQGHRVLAFAKTRRGVEKAFSHIQDREVERIAPYRAGYLPEVRREIQEAMARGELMGLLATSALELGIDIGDLTAVLVVGFPGSKMALYQRCGRAGRTLPGLCMFVPSLDALDQYYRDHPERLLDFHVEEARLWPHNPYVLAQHAALSVWELAEVGFSLNANLLERIFGEGAEAALEDFARNRPDLFDRFLRRRGEVYFSRMRRHELISRVGLRHTGETWEIWDETTGELLGTIAPPHLYEETYPFAVYYHLGETYEVIRWDQEAHRVFVRPFRLAVETEVHYDTDVEIRRIRKERPMGSWRLFLGDVRVVRTYIGLTRYRKGTREVLDTLLYEEPIRYAFETTALWLVGEASSIWEAYARHDVVEILRRNPSLPEFLPAYQLGAGLHGAEHGAIGLFPTAVLADRSDLGGLSTPFHPQTERPTVFIYDGVEGGAGFAETAFGRFEEIAAATRDRIRRCRCELDSGCPSCIQSPKCGNANRILSKAGALAVLELWLEKAF